MLAVKTIASTRLSPCTAESEMRGSASNKANHHRGPCPTQKPRSSIDQMITPDNKLAMTTVSNRESGGVLNGTTRAQTLNNSHNKATTIVKGTDKLASINFLDFLARVVWQAISGANLIFGCSLNRLKRALSKRTYAPSLTIAGRQVTSAT